MESITSIFALDPSTTHPKKKTKMFKQLAIFAVVAVALVYAAPAADEAPTPYEFAFQEANANHTLARQESGDASGAIHGQYSYVDKDGLTRTVKYTADDNGFQAQVSSNEPGLTNSAPAAATYHVQ